MKKKNIAICTVIAIVIVVGVWLLLRPKALGNINAYYVLSYHVEFDGLL